MLIIEWILGLLLLIIGIAYGIILIAYPLKATSQQSPTIIMILGCPATKDGQVSPIMQTRLTAALQLWRSGHYQTILVSGGAVANQYHEADIMGRALRQAGVPATAILSERTSTNTFLNFKNSLPLIGNAAVVIVTSSWHARKGAFYARHLQIPYRIQLAADLPGHWWWLHFRQYPRYYFKMLYQLCQLPFWHEF